MKLIFVYNATSGAINAVIDSAHKLLSPETYNCSLCELTFGVFAEKETWKRFRKTSEIDMIFLHKDEFLKQYRSKWLPKYTFPVILIEENQQLEIFISVEALNAMEDVSSLIEGIKERVS